MSDEKTPRVVYEDTIEGGHVCFLRVCPVCHRLVRAEATSTLAGETTNATCSAHGPVRMPCEGYF